MRVRKKERSVPKFFQNMLADSLIFNPPRVGPTQDATPTSKSRISTHRQWRQTQLKHHGLLSYGDRLRQLTRCKGMLILITVTSWAGCSLRYAPWGMPQHNKNTGNPTDDAFILSSGATRPHVVQGRTWPRWVWYEGTRGAWGWAGWWRCAVYRLMIIHEDILGNLQHVMIKITIFNIIMVIKRMITIIRVMIMLMWWILVCTWYGMGLSGAWRM